MCNADSLFNRTGDQYCVSADVICDGINDCPLGEDEATSFCYRDTTCGGRINVTTEADFLTSPNYPRDHGNNENCTWQLVAPPAHRIELIILDLLLEGSSDGCYDALTVMIARASTWVMMLAVRVVMTLAVHVVMMLVVCGRGGD